MYLIVLLCDNIHHFVDHLSLAQHGIQIHEQPRNIHVMTNYISELLKNFTSWQITLANYKNYIRKTGRMDIPSIHQVSFVCPLYVATSMCQIYVQLTWCVCVVCACIFLLFSINSVVQIEVLCSSICSAQLSAQHTLQFK